MTTDRRVVVTEYGAQEIRAIALREAISYFAYARRQAPSDPPVGARVVIGIADHFATYISTGEHPKPEDVEP